MSSERRNEKLICQRSDEDFVFKKENVTEDDIIFDSRGSFELPSFDSLDEQFETFYNSRTSHKTEKGSANVFAEKESPQKLEFDVKDSGLSSFGSYPEKFGCQENAPTEHAKYSLDTAAREKEGLTLSQSYLTKPCSIENGTSHLEMHSQVILDKESMKQKDILVGHKREIQERPYNGRDAFEGNSFMVWGDSLKANRRNELYNMNMCGLKRKHEFFGVNKQLFTGTSSSDAGQIVDSDCTSTLSERDTKNRNSNNFKNPRIILPQDFETSFLHRTDGKLIEAQRDFFRQEFHSLPLKVSLQGEHSCTDAKREYSSRDVCSSLLVDSVSPHSNNNNVNKNYVKYPVDAGQRQVGDTKSDVANKSSILTSRLHRFPLKPKILFGVIELLHFLRSKNLPSNDPRYFVLMKLLKAHVVPYPNSILSFKNLFALRVQYRIFYEMKKGKSVSEEIVNASRALTAKNVTTFENRKIENNKSAPSDAKVANQIESMPFPVESFSGVLNLPPLDNNFLRKEADRLVSILSKRATSNLEKELSKSVCNDKEKKRILQMRYVNTSLVGLQRRIRGRIAEERRLAEREGKLGSKSRFRSFRVLMKEAEKIERFMIKEMEAQEREKRKNFMSFLSSLMNHVSNFRQYHKEYVCRLRKCIARSVARYHEEKARTAEKAEKEAERRRIIALKENDEEAYVSLLHQTKNERLLQVLNQTDEYLRHLGAVVKRQRDGDVIQDNLYPSKEEPTNTDLLSRDNCQTYYEIAHAIKEPITELPSILKGGTLKQYQIQGLQWLVSLYVNHLNGILADEMGLGKTIQAIALLTYLVEKKNNNGPFLIVVPLSTLSNWELEFEKWAPSLHVVVFKGDRRQRKSIYDTIIQPFNFNVCLTTFEFVSRGKNLLGKIEWSYMIVDEGHRMKNHESRITGILSQHFKSHSRLLMTGTPLQNSLSELWSLLNFVLPNIFSSSETFESWFSAPFASIPGEKADLSEEETLLIIRRLHQVLRPFLLRRLKSDVLRMGDQLPTKQEHVILCDISAWQKMVYRKILRRQKVVFTGLSGRRRHDFLSNPAMQLRKMANHPYLFYEDYSEELLLENRDSEELFRASGKFYMFDMLLQKFLETGHRILVFNQMTRVIDLQERLLRFRGIPFLRLDGSTKAEIRRKIVEEFNSNDTIYHVLLLTTRAGGLGVNLQSADTVIIFDSDWNPQMDLQAQDRAHRIGQNKEVLVLRIVAANTIEERILERASYKKDMEQKVIRAGMFNETSKDSDRQALLRELLKDDEERSVEGHESRVPDLETINAMISRSESEIEIFQQIDQRRQVELNGRSPLMEASEIPSWVNGDIDEDKNSTDWSRSKSEYMLNEDESSYSFHTVSSDDDISYQTNEWQVQPENKRKRLTDSLKQPDSAEWCDNDAMLKSTECDYCSDLLESGETCNEHSVERDDRESEYSDDFQKSYSERASVCAEELNGSYYFTEDETYSNSWEELEMGEET